MSGRNSSLAGKRRPKNKKPGAKPNATRQRQLALRKKKYRNSALFARREAEKADAAAAKAVAATE